MKIKLCGLTRECDIEWANDLKPDYIGFVFAQKSRRYVSPDKARMLKNLLDPSIKAVGVFANEEMENIASLLNEGIIDVAQLHGQESAEDIRKLRSLTSTDKKIIQAFRIDIKEDVTKANDSLADFVLLDSGCGGTGTSFEWDLLKEIKRDYFLAGGLDATKIPAVKKNLKPYAVDVSSGIERDGYKDQKKMAAFVKAVREGE